MPGKIMIQYYRCLVQTKLSLSIISFLLLSEALLGQVDIHEANNSFFNLNLDDATHKYSVIFTDKTASDGDRINAGSRLIYIAWHFKQDIFKARKYVEEASTLMDSVRSIYPAIIPSEVSASNYIEAKEYVDKALSTQQTERQRLLVYKAYADLVLQESIYRLEHGIDLSYHEIALALRRITLVNQQDPGRLKPAKLQLGLSLLLQDGKGAMEAWRVYYHLTEGEHADGLLRGPELELNRILSSWQGERLNKNDEEKLIKYLAESRFYDLAYMLILFTVDETTEPYAQNADIYNYYRFTKQVDSITTLYYRQIAVTGSADRDLLEKSISDIQEELWEKLSWIEKKPKYSVEKFINVIYERFGTKIYAGDYNNIQYYIGGHTIVDTMLQIQQHKYAVEVPYYELDHRFSNNYWGWFTGYMGFAGYGSNQIIARYREPSAELPISYWQRLTDPVLLENWHELIIKETRNEEENPNAGYTDPSLGVYNRILYSTLKGILDSISGDYSDDAQTRIKFLHVINDIMIERNINHEGRHAIDFSIMKRKELSDGAILEYRALLSQIYFSDFPLFEIRFDIDDSPHGKANEKILTNLTDWMISNQEDIPGFNPLKPTITQIDLLNNNQLRVIMISNDPIAN